MSPKKEDVASKSPFSSKTPFYQGIPLIYRFPLLLQSSYFVCFSGRCTLSCLEFAFPNSPLQLNAGNCRSRYSTLVLGQIGSRALVIFFLRPSPTATSISLNQPSSSCKLHHTQPPSFVGRHLATDRSTHQSYHILIHNGYYFDGLRKRQRRSLRW